MRRDPSEEDDRGYEEEATVTKQDDEVLQKGNTMEYYNEDLSRKAVGRLFDGGAGKEEDSDEAFVKGFSDKPERPERKPERKKERFAEGAAENPYDDEGVRERKRDKYDRYDDDKDAEKSPGGPGKKPEKNMERKSERGVPKSTPQPSPAVRVSHKPGASGGRAPHNPGRVMPGDSAYSSGKHRHDAFGEDYTQFKRKYEDRDYVTGQKKRPPAPPRPGAVAGVGVGDPRRPDDGYDEPENTGLLKIVFGAVVIVFLVVLAILCFRINDINAKYQEAKNKLDTSQNYGDYNSIKIENEQLIADKADLQKQIDTLTAQLAAAGLQTVPPSEPPEASGAPGDTQPPEQSGAVPSEWPKSYTVVSGDSLSNIARNFYGSASQTNIDKIKNYNNLTSDNIFPGDVLKIPE